MRCQRRRHVLGYAWHRPGANAAPGLRCRHVFFQALRLCQWQSPPLPSYAA